MQNCLFVSGATFAASNWQFFFSICSWVIGGYFFGNFNRPWLSDFCVRFKFASCQIGIGYVAEFLLIIFFLFSLDRAAFWSCSCKCLRRAA